tara:strand:+ start:185 stop:556 length:372 start_codon:yes stop_codon:yes gene_type:complete
MNDSNYKSISDVAKLLNLINNKNGKLNTHTIRYWEKEFKHIKPKLFSGKRRYYDDKSIEKLKEIKFLLKEKGLTISGVKKYLYNKNSLPIDLSDNNTIRTHKINIKTKIKKISKIIKDIKKIN